MPGRYQFLEHECGPEVENYEGLRTVYRESTGLLRVERDGVPVFIRSDAELTGRRELQLPRRMNGIEAHRFIWDNIIRPMGKRLVAGIIAPPDDDRDLTIFELVRARYDGPIDETL